MSDRQSDRQREHAFTQIYGQHFQHVWRSLRRFGVPDQDLEDVAHDVFVVVHRRLDSYDPARPIRPWLSGIARRVARDERKRAHHHRELVQDDIRVVSTRPDPEASLGQLECHRQVQRALSRLPDAQAQVVAMRDGLGMTVPEIGAVLGEPINTLYARLRLGKQKFERAWRAVSASPMQSAAS